MIKKIFISLSLLLIVGAVSAGENHSGAATNASSRNGDDQLFSNSFAELDANGDGRISWPEARASGISHATFYSVETIENDYISRAEYDAAVAAYPEGVVGKPVQKKRMTRMKARYRRITRPTTCASIRRLRSCSERLQASSTPLGIEVPCCDRSRALPDKIKTIRRI